VVEKRKERRIRVNLPIRITYKKGPEVLGMLENASRLGGFLETDRHIPPGTEVGITLNIPIYTEDLALSGEVRCKGTIFRSDLVKESGPKKYYGTGIFFTDFLSKADSEKLSRYIDFLIAQEEKDVKDGIKRWREKKEDHHGQVLGLLKLVLDRLEEISRLLKSKNKSK